MEGHFKLTYSLFKGTFGVILQVTYLEKQPLEIINFQQQKNISIVHGFKVQNQKGTVCNFQIRVT